MITIEDIRNPRRKSGFNHVTSNQNRGGSQYQKPWVACLESDEGGCTKRGPRRATPQEAAQDFVDYANTGNVRTVALKTGGHKTRTPRKPEELSPAEKRLRRASREVAKERQGRQGYVYCIAEQPDEGELTTILRLGDRLVATGPVKIGYSYDPEVRVGEVQHGNPRQLRLLGYFPGTMDDEANLHARFIKQNLIGEWFRPTKELLSLFDRPGGTQ